MDFVTESMTASSIDSVVFAIAGAAASTSPVCWLTDVAVDNEEIVVLGKEMLVHQVRLALHPVAAQLVATFDKTSISLLASVTPRPYYGIVGLR
jgi:hypothetical protein